MLDNAVLEDLEVLTAQQAHARARIAAIDARAARFTDTDGLFVAIGEGVDDLQ